MGANADPTGVLLGGPHHRNPSPAAALAPPPQHGVGASTAAALRHDPGLSVRWTPEEQAVLEGGLASYAADAAVVRYAKIAMNLPDKTVRDVALRCRWMAKKESNKKRKEESSKKNKEKKERANDSSSKGPAHLVARPNATPYSLPVLPMDDDDVSYKTIGGQTGQILEHNAQILNQIYTNISNMQVQENIPLLCQTRDNILAVLKEIGDVPEIMRQMPPLPVKLNEDLANSMLPRPPHT
uniref:Myb-like domain-containing protein n=1 Tax=Oryza punctata TaxID=4537 RepID=A0A0E0L0S5_ORYPU